MKRWQVKQFANRVYTLFAARNNGLFRQPVFLLTTGRSGSNLFVDLSNSLGSIVLLGEVLNPTAAVGLPRVIRSRRRIVAHIQRSLRSAGAEYAGAKIHFEHLHLRGVGIDLLAECFPDALIVLLYRNRIADQFVSWKLARQSGRWVGKSKAHIARGTIRVEREEFDWYRQRQTARYANALCDDWLRQRVLTVDYETLVAQPQEVFERRVCPFLGLPYSPVATGMVKQNSRSLRETVTNYDEVAELLESTLMADNLRDLLPDATAPCCPT